MINLENTGNNLSNNLNDGLTKIELELKKRLEFLVSLSNKLPPDKTTDDSLVKSNFASQLDNLPAKLPTNKKPKKAEITGEHTTNFPYKVNNRGQKSISTPTSDIYEQTDTSNTDVKVFSAEITNLITTEVLSRVLESSSVSKLNEAIKELPNLVQMANFFSQNYTTINNFFSSVTNISSKVANEEKPDDLDQTSYLTGRHNYLARQKKLAN